MQLLPGEVRSGAIRKHKNWEQLKFPHQKVGVCQGWCETAEGADRDSCKYLLDSCYSKPEELTNY